MTNPPNPLINANAFSQVRASIAEALQTQTGYTLVEDANGNLSLFHANSFLSTLATPTATVLNQYSIIPANPAAETSATFIAAGLSNGPGSSTISNAPGYPSGVTAMTLAATTNFFVGENVLIAGGSATAEIVTVASITGSVLSFTSGTLFAHVNSQTVVGIFGITPSSTGRLIIEVQGALTGAAGDLVSAQIVIGSAVTAAPPAVDAAVPASAVAVGNVAIYTAVAGALQSNFSCSALLGVSPYATDTAPSGGAARLVGTPYYIDIQFKSSAGAAQLTNLSVLVREV